MEIILKYDINFVSQEDSKYKTDCLLIFEQTIKYEITARVRAAMRDRSSNNVLELTGRIQQQDCNVNNHEGIGFAAIWLHLPFIHIL